VEGKTPSVTTSDIPAQVLRYIEMVEKCEIQACEEQHLLVGHVRRCFETETLYVNEKQVENYLRLAKYFPFERLFEWEEFCFILHNCVFRADGMPRWPDLFILTGRGAGKDGYLGFEAFALTSEYNGIPQYHVDICANNEEQAREPFNDIHLILDNPANNKKLKRFFYWNQEKITNLQTMSTIRYRTNSPKGKDGLRSGIVQFNELHQYQDYANINVFTTGLGKKKHPRRTYATTNGDVRDGPLDHLIERAEEILRNGAPDDGLLAFLCKLNKRDDVHNPELWEMANPSLPYRPDLQEQIAKEYKDWARNPAQFSAFMTKRMNIPDGNAAIQVTSWDNILSTNQPVPDFEGGTAVAGIDYSKINDFAAAGVLLRQGDVRYWISHSWVCRRSVDLPRVKAPWREWEKEGLLTVVDDVEINPDFIAEWVAGQLARFNIPMLALDNFRYALLAKSLRAVGFDYAQYKNVKLVRPSDVMKVSPVIESLFANHNIVWGDNPLMRWYTNNTMMIRTGINAKTGNMTYGKIEGRSRKTDGFMAFVAAMTVESELGDCDAGGFDDLPVFTF
jgi:phage terminase large subunit-like protein